MRRRTQGKEPLPTPLSQGTLELAKDLQANLDHLPDPTQNDGVIGKVLGSRVAALVTSLPATERGSFLRQFLTEALAHELAGDLDFFFRMTEADRTSITTQAEYFNRLNLANLAAGQVVEVQLNVRGSAAAAPERAVVFATTHQPGVVTALKNVYPFSRHPSASELQAGSDYYIGVPSEDHTPLRPELYGEQQLYMARYGTDTTVPLQIAPELYNTDGEQRVSQVYIGNQLIIPGPSRAPENRFNWRA